jgi:hypothetical protein
MSWDRFYACGSFCSAVAKLDSLLSGRSNSDEIRVLLLHQSVQYSGKTVTVHGGRSLPGSISVTRRHLTIDDASRTALASLTRKFDIRVILTGHVHDPPFLGRITAGAFSSGPDCWESCCATTTQGLVAKKGTILGSNGFVVHRIDFDHQSIFWKAEAQTFLLGTKLRGYAPFPVPAPPNTSFSIRLSP